MTQAISTRRDGDRFQARLFWKKAARMLIATSNIARVGFEVGPKSFDDIWVDYSGYGGQSITRGFQSPEITTSANGTSPWGITATLT